MRKNLSNTAMAEIKRNDGFPGIRRDFVCSEADADTTRSVWTEALTAGPRSPETLFSDPPALCFEPEKKDLLVFSWLLPGRGFGCVVAEISGARRGSRQPEVDKGQLLPRRRDCRCSSTFSNPLVSSEPQVCPICIVGVFDHISVDLNILWGLGQISSMPNAMIRDFWNGR